MLQIQIYAVIESGANYCKWASMLTAVVQACWTILENGDTHFHCWPP